MNDELEGMTKEEIIDSVNRLVSQGSVKAVWDKEKKDFRLYVSGDLNEN